jgi:S-adenosylmethionine-dependent methyltransferase
MSDDIQDIQDYYNADAEYEDRRLEGHQLERDLTKRYLEMYLPPANLQKAARILEIGAATGVYTLWLAQRGYKVVAVDLSEQELAYSRKRIESAGLLDLVTYRVDDARFLEQVPEQDFEAVLLMGPLYHLILEADRLMAIRQAVQRLKPGGVFFSSFISRFGILGDLLRNVPGWIEDGDEVRGILDVGRDPDHYPKGGFRGYFATIGEIRPLLEQAGLETLVLAGVEPAISADDESYNRLEGRRRELWQDLLYEVSREPSMLASSRHLLYIGKTPALSEEPGN